MSKRIGVILSEEAFQVFRQTLKEANDQFEGGRIRASDLINEIILSSSIDIKALQRKHMDLRCSLKSLMQRKELDLEAVFELLSELRPPATRKRKGQTSEEGSEV